MQSQLVQTLASAKSRETQQQAQELFASLIQGQQYVGEVYSTSYETALVLIHDRHRMNVGGIPSLSFLIATRVNPNELVDFTIEDSSIILLRVMDAASLPNASEAERIRVESAQRVSGTYDEHWDGTGAMDAQTSHLLSFAGVKCRVLGTFYLDLVDPTNPETNHLIWRYGDDISNYYPNRGLKVYKPNDEALAQIVNYRDLARFEGEEPMSFSVGEVRYASTNRAFQGVSSVHVDMIPEDLLGQKTAVFGMTRTGKSNTTKIIIQSVFCLRFRKPLRRIGQLIFDPNGEYANENVQDQSGNNPNAIKNVWMTDAGGQQADVVTYGLLPHPNDPNRRLMLLNFYTNENLQIGKEIIDASLAGQDATYLRNFRQIVFEAPDPNDRSAMTRYKRRVLTYRALLAKAGFIPPTSVQADTRGLFNNDLRQAMQNHSDPEFQAAARIFSEAHPKWQQLSTSFEALEKFIKTDEYRMFDTNYVANSSSGETWAEDDFKKILTMFAYPNGSRLMGNVRNQHTPDTSTDYAEDIYEDLVQGRLVIVDQASGDPVVNQASASRIMWHIFLKNQGMFRNGESPHSVLIYVEEAHTLLPAGSELDLKDVWVRTAKEGAKYNLGLVYATQEVSSIQKNILKNTANWFIGHLNNTDETKELCKYYDFADFEQSIRRAQDRGFLRMKTLSNRFVIPVQVRKFEV